MQSRPAATCEGRRKEVDTHSPLLVRDGRIALLEIKDGRKPPSAGQLTPLEREVHEAFAAAGVPIVVVMNVEELLALR